MHTSLLQGQRKPQVHHGLYQNYLCGWKAKETHFEKLSRRCKKGENVEKRYQERTRFTEHGSVFSTNAQWYARHKQAKLRGNAPCQKTRVGLFTPVVILAEKICFMCFSFMLFFFFISEINVAKHKMLTNNEAK